MACTSLPERFRCGALRNVAPPMPPPRRRVLRWGWAVSVAALAAAVSCRPSAAAQAAPAANRVPYDLVVLVVARPGAAERVAVSYAGLVEGERLRGAVQRLAAETGARVTGLVVSDEPVARGSQVRATAAEFTAKGLLGPSGGPLPVAAFAEALPEWRRMRLVFVVGESFPFTGPDRYAGESFSATLIKGTDVYEYDVVKMNGESAPAAEPSHQGRKLPVRGGASSRGAPIAAAAATVAAAAWFAWWRSKRRARGRRPGASASEPAPEERGSTVSENRSNGNGA